MRIRILVSMVSLFTSFVIGGCAAVTPTVAPTATAPAPATSTPQPVFITATPWIVTATPAPTTTNTPTPKATVTPTVIPVKFEAYNWTSNSTLDQFEIQSKIGPRDIQYVDIKAVVQGHTINIAVPQNLDFKWSELVPQGAPTPNNFSDFIPSQARSIVTSYLTHNFDADGHLNAQLASLWTTFRAKHPNGPESIVSDTMFFVLGMVDGKLQVSQVVDVYNSDKPVTYAVSTDGSVGVESTPTEPIPTRTPIPSFSWSTGFESLDNMNDNYNFNRRGRYSLIPDPTGSDRGMVMKCEAAPDLAYFDPQYQPLGKTVVRSYPAEWFPAKSGSHLTGVDVYLVDDFAPPVGAGYTGLSFLSDFYDTGTYGKEWQYTVTANLSKMRGRYYATLGITQNGWATEVPNAPPFTFNQWHRLEILVTAERQIILYQDGHIVSIGNLPAGVPLATAGGHPGLYGLSNNGVHSPPFTSGTLYNDNWTIVVYPP